MKKIRASFRGFLERFVKTESASSLVLASCTLLAMIIANSPAAPTYFELLNNKFLGLSLGHWINDGLMAIFFFLIGMEIKREIIGGELSSIKRAALPIWAAVGGMVFPACIYLLFNHNSPSSVGWAIPMATDIAFALGVLTLFGKKVALSLKVFLLALAIVDDLGAILVIAFFYTNEIRASGFYIAAIAVLAILLARSTGNRSYLPYIPLGVILWLGVLYSGVHATIAGVILGILTPHTYPIKKNAALRFSPLDELIHKLHPWVSYGIMPIFALANAGIPLEGAGASVTSNPISIGIFLGLVLGKPLGILLFSFASVYLGIASLPENLKWRHLAGASCLAGIGFTMAIFITNLSLPPEEGNLAKIAILAASAVSAGLGCLLLTLAPRGNSNLP